MKQLDYCMANPLIADQGFSYVTTYVYMSIHRHIASMYTDFVQFLEYQGLGLHGILSVLSMANWMSTILAAHASGCYLETPHFEKLV